MTEIPVNPTITFTRDNLWIIKRILTFINDTQDTSEKIFYMAGHNKLHTSRWSAMIFQSEEAAKEYWDALRLELEEKQHVLGRAEIVRFYDEIRGAPLNV